jgi:hypothetical protein
MRTPDETAEIRTLEVVGRDVSVNATGALFRWSETDQSNLTLHADSPSLEEIGKIVGAPLTGIARSTRPSPATVRSCRPTAPRRLRRDLSG